MQITTKIKKILYPKEKTSEICWRIISTADGVFKGSSPNFKIGSTVTFTGNHSVYNGEKEFSFTGAEPYIPTNQKEKLFLTADIAKGIGEKIVEKIWTELGENWEEITPEHHIISESKIKVLKEALATLNSNVLRTKVLAFLMSKGITKLVSEKAFEKWKVDAITLVEDNPYILTGLSRVGFIEVDTRIRHQFGIKDDSRERIESCINYCINSMTSRGDSIVEWDVFAREVIKLLKIEPKLVTPIVVKMIEDDYLYYFIDEKMITTAKKYNQEKEIYDFLKKD